MNRRLQWTERALKDASKLDRRAQERIFTALDRLAADPAASDIRKLQGRERTWRLRVGDWRVICELHNDAGVILVQQVEPRGRAYRG